MNEQVPQMNKTDENFAEYLFNDEKTLASLCHLSFLGGFIFPFVGSFIGLFLIWFYKKGLFSFVDRNLREAVNFQVTMVILNLLVMSVAFYSLVVIYVAWGLSIFTFCSSLYGALVTFQGKSFRYPVNLRIWREKASAQ